MKRLYRIWEEEAEEAVGTMLRALESLTMSRRRRMKMMMVLVMMTLMVMMIKTCRRIEGACPVRRAASQGYWSRQPVVAPPTG